MDMTGEYRIAAPRQAVWDALNDPEILKACIPGCKELDKSSDTEMTATVVSKIGPVKATFKGAVTLDNLNPPESYTISGEGKGGVAGFAKGGADVSLVEEGAETVLNYTAKAQVGGKLAQLGSRLIDSTARKMADDFFSKFAQTVAAASDDSTAATSEEPDVAVIEEAKSIANQEMSEHPEKVVEDLVQTAGETAKHVAEGVVEAEHKIEEVARSVEEKVEVAAGQGKLGGPMVWGIIVLGLLVIAILLVN
ncbi:MAG: carbon monoxide dehydrogenase subunit G [Stappiaceae bacterium]